MNALAPLPSDARPVAALPHNLEAEQALLGSLMFDNAVFERLSDRLRGSHFYEPFHQRLFDAVEDHIRQGLLAEPTILMERFKGDPAFQEFGGLRYLADLVDRAPPGAHAPDYARVVYDLALRRDLIRIGGDIIKEAPDPETPAMDQIESAEQSLYSLAETGQPSSGFISFSQVADWITCRRSPDTCAREAARTTSSRSSSIPATRTAGPGRSSRRRSSAGCTTSCDSCCAPLPRRPPNRL